MAERKNPSKYLSRKFLLHVAALFAGIVALFLDKISGSEFVALSGAVGGSYGIANVGWQFAARTQANTESQQRPPGWGDSD